VDALRNDDTGAPPNGRSHSVLVFQPSIGAYTVALTGRQLGSYILEVGAFSTDGTAQPGISLTGVTNLGSSSTFLLQFSSAPGSSLTASRIASFQSALADISNGLELGLIDNAGIAAALTEKINAAQAAANAGQNQTAVSILNAFNNQLSAQAGKHINGIAPQVLQEDANSLISQLQ
jgi:hypothetical protein